MRELTFNSCPRDWGYQTTPATLSPAILNFRLRTVGLAELTALLLWGPIIGGEALCCLVKEGDRRRAAQVSLLYIKNLSQIQ